ncbi:MAG: histidine phosphatase family protein [Gammaproteobacteria bacterium]
MSPIETMQILFMRHGQTNYNLFGLCNDDPGRDVYLTTTGIAQAEAAAERLRQTPLDMIVTSELPRTRQTAEIVNRYHQLELRQHPALNDIRSGFDGQPVSEYFAAIAADPLHLAVNGGESLLSHKQRVLGYLDWLRQQPAQAVLSIAHEETLRVFYAWFHRIPDERLRDLHFSNCEVVQFEFKTGT